MKTKILSLIIVSLMLTACAGSSRVVSPNPPVPQEVNALKSNYRKTVEVILVRCIEKETLSSVYVGDHRKANNKNQYMRTTETISVVETTATGERFEMYGCYGNPGDRFRISY